MSITTLKGKRGGGMEGERRRRGLGGEASWSHETHPKSGLAVQAGGSLRGYGGMSDMNKAGLVSDEHSENRHLIAVIRTG